MRNPVLKRLLVRVIAIFALTGIVAGAWALDIVGVISLPMFMTARTPLGAMVVWVPVFAGQAYLFIQLRRLKRRLRAADGMLCPTCAYDLRGVGREAPCPECGAALDAETVRNAWKDVNWQ